MRSDWLRAGSAIACAVLALGITGVAAQETCEPVVGRLASVENEVEVQRSDGTGWRRAELALPVCEGDSIRTGARSRAAIALVNEAVLRVDEETTLRLVDIVDDEEGTSFLELVRGLFQSFSRAPRRLAIDTPYMNATIEGTEFVLAAADDQSTITVLEGVVAVENEQGAARVASGQAAVAEAGQAPRQVTVVTPRDAVQWSLYYPPIIALPSADGDVGAAGAPALRQALALAREGRTGQALARLDEVPESGRGPAWHVYRASLLLSVGRVEAASVAIERALAADPGAGTAHALRAIIHVVRNEPEAALAAARRGVEASPGASAPKVALSYALQARFDLEAARDVLLDAIRDDPENPLLWARLAELHLSLGGRRQAREAAERALELSQAGGAASSAAADLVIRAAAFAPSAAAVVQGPRATLEMAQAAPPGPGPLRLPELERALVVLGFANLAEFDTAEARRNFARAIEFDPADPLPHFGFGLAQIRDGELEDGRRNIEVAVALDSNSSVLRSYLGKAYFEEKRSPLDARQFEIAKELDPQDPTPYLYDAIRKQTEGRPVEALGDLQRSIELNDNRAVYRSRLQLDEDRAARGTSLARIYDDLGFQELGLKEAARSVSADPTNASAHRFLSDIYGGIRRREIGRVSELFQAQMLQHVNINPVQPSVSETNLNIVTSGGPTEVGFNEFTPLFERDRGQLNVSGFAGTNDTLGGEAVASMLYDRYSLSAGYFHYETDGWRANSDIEHDVYNAFFQTALTPDLDAQVELTRRESETGDIDLQFDPDSFFPEQRLTYEQDTGRVGLRYGPTPNSDLLLSAIYSNIEQAETDAFGIPDVGLVDLDNAAQDEGYQLEAQYLFREDVFNVISGIAYSAIRADRDILLAQDGTPIFGSPFVSSNDLTSTRPYVYGNLQVPTPVIWTLGLSFDNFDEVGFELNQVNPKFGVQWNITDDLLLRGAAFRFVKPSLVNNRTLEPSQVAGFNQFFDDINGTDSYRFGIGLDWEARDDLFLGAEATWRDFDTPLAPAFVDQEERSHRAYAYWTPFRTVALSAEFVYDHFSSENSRFTREAPFVTPEELETFSVPLGIRYFHPSGLFGHVGATFVKQDVDRSELNELGLTDGDDEFVLFDASVGYRLPRRLGVVSLEVSNLTDEDFNYQDDSFREFQDRPSIGPYFPERQVLGRITLNW